MKTSQLQSDNYSKATFDEFRTALKDGKLGFLYSLNSITVMVSGIKQIIKACGIPELEFQNMSSEDVEAFCELLLEGNYLTPESEWKFSYKNGAYLLKYFHFTCWRARRPVPLQYLSPSTFILSRQSSKNSGKIYRRRTFEKGNVSTDPLRQRKIYLGISCKALTEKEMKIIFDFLDKRGIDYRSECKIGLPRKKFSRIGVA